MNPFFFGKSTQQLFGAYDPPESQARDRAVVLCPAIGDEYLFAHPTYRLVARQLAAAGYHVLRFDYVGTGDSAGLFEDATPRQWTDDIETAIAEVKDLGGVSSATLVGLRYGAVLAATVAQRRSDVDRLVLWDPIDDGRSYLDEIGATAASSNETVDACGVVVTPGLRAEIEQVTVETFGSLRLPTTLVLASSAAASGADAVFRRLQSARLDSTLHRVEDEPAWRERRVGAGAMSVASARDIVGWLS